MVHRPWTATFCFGLVLYAQIAVSQSAEVDLSAGLVERPPASDCPEVYLVQAGDFPERIADSCGVELSLILEANPDLDPSNLVVGQRLTIPGGAPTDLVVHDDQCGPSYMVRQGDTPASIAAHCGVHLDALLEANKGIEADALIVGQLLDIPPPARDEPPDAILVADPPFPSGAACSFMETSAVIGSEGVAHSDLEQFTSDLSTAALLAFLGAREDRSDQLIRVFGRPGELSTFLVPADLRVLSEPADPIAVYFRGDEIDYGHPALVEWRRILLHRSMTVITASANWELSVEPVQAAHLRLQHIDPSCDAYAALDATARAVQQEWDKQRMALE